MTQLLRLGLLTLGLLPSLSAACGADEPARPEGAPLKIHLLGSGEYKPVESLTEYKKYLEARYRVEITTSFSKDNKSLPNLESLRKADVMVVFLRRMNLPEEQMAIIRDHWEKGKPVVAMRTASHAFQPADNEVWDKKVLGGGYTGYGNSNPFKAIPAEGKGEHPILKGVEAITSHTYYNNNKLAESAIVLQIVESEKKNKPPVTWVNNYKDGRTFYTSMGVPEDFQNENFRRLLANAIFWTTRRDPATMKLAEQPRNRP